MWLFGFVSGAAHVTVDATQAPLAGTSASGIEKWVTTYCTDHPGDAIVSAALLLVDELTAK